MYTESEVLDFVKEEDVRFVRLAFFDITGRQKNISIMAGELERAFRDGIAFDASAVKGFENPNRSDLFLHPEPATLAVLPWRPMTGKVIRLFCGIKYPDGTPYEYDSRYILQKAVEKAKAEAGIEFKFGTEIEFYLFQLDQNGNPSKVPFDQAGYMDIAPDDKGENIRRDICFTLEQMGIIPEASHHEEGPGQNEIDFHYSDPVSAADNNSTFKWIVRTKAFGNGLCADFSPKPIADEAGSGMHINLSYKVPEKEDRPEIFDYIIGGILNNIKDMTYFLNPSRQSYLRLGEFKAPKYIAYGSENRSTCLRIPATKGDRRIEIRSPDPGCNPYIAYTLLIYAALDGIKNKSIPPKEVTENLFDSDSAASLKLDLLPSTLEKAHKNAAASKFITTYLGKEFIKKYGI